MLIDHSSGLGSAVTVWTVEIESGDAVFAECALKGSSAVQRFSCV